ncbi:MAG TPA: DUF4112 domain-containing protein [Acidobacteriaceae bacterium]|jgi:hypothetical protein|nr:DUF4112 domain-containing protein [Acidobacteriaceae bacterium]
MADPQNPQILPPAQPGRTRAQSLVSDENLDLLAHLLDDWFAIPGTSIRVGLDGVIGLIPGLGDILAGLASCILIVAAWLRGVPWVTLLRMAVNVGLEVAIGAVPFLGDIFVIAWKANRRNYRLMTLHLREPHRHTGKDVGFLLCLLGGVVAILAAPFVVLLIIVVWILHRM